MFKFDERLYCFICHEKFIPETKRLLRSNDEKFKKHLFMAGQHSKCGQQDAGYLGINGKESTYFKIRNKEVPKWFDRFDTDLIKEQPVKLREGDSKKRMKTVNGFKCERNSGKWMEQIQAVK